MIQEVRLVLDVDVHENSYWVGLGVGRDCDTRWLHILHDKGCFGKIGCEIHIGGAYEVSC